MMSLKSQAELYRLKQLGKNRNFAQKQRYEMLNLKYKADKLDYEDLKNRGLIFSLVALEVVEQNNQNLQNLIRNSIRRHATSKKQSDDLISLYDEYLITLRKELKETAKQKSKNNENKNKQNQNH